MSSAHDRATSCCANRFTRYAILVHHVSYVVNITSNDEAHNHPVLAFLDRVNIGNANVFGLSEELDLETGNKYNAALVIFFVPYCIFEIPSNILLKKLKPHVWLSLNMFLFGFVTIMQGLVQSYGGLLATRFFLGVFETGMFPGCFYLIGYVHLTSFIGDGSGKLIDVECGIEDTKRRSATHSSSALRPSQVPLADF